MNVLILGGNGFIGSHVADKFRAAGHEVDTSGDDSLKGVDIVVHSYSSTIPATSNDRMVYDVDSNLLDTIELIDDCAKARVGKFIYISSGGTIYGQPKKCPVPETAPTEPLCSYGIVKLAVEKYLALFHRLHGLDYTIIRPSNPYGPRQKPNTGQGVIATMLHRIANGEPVEIWGDGSVIRDFIYVTDLAEAIYRAAVTPTKSRIFNVGSGFGMHLTDVLQVAEEFAPVKMNWRHARACDVESIWLDCSRAKAELDWVPTVPFERGLELTWEAIAESVPA